MKPPQQAQFFRLAETKMTTVAEASELRKQANENARAMLTGMFGSLGSQAIFPTLHKARSRAGGATTAASDRRLCLPGRRRVPGRRRLFARRPRRLTVMWFFAPLRNSAIAAVHQASDHSRNRAGEG